MPPEHFTVSYRINPWMEPAQPTDTALAVRQWETLYDTYQRLGIRVRAHRADRWASPTWSTRRTAASCSTASPTARGSSYAERRCRRARPTWSGSRPAGCDVVAPAATNEGEGDFLLVGETIFAGTGFRSDAASHREAGAALRSRGRDPAAGRPELLPPRHRLRRPRSCGRAGSRRLPSPSLRRGESRHPRAPIPGRGHRHRRGRRRPRAELVQRWPQRRDREPGGDVRRATSPSAATSRTASTCRSCCWAAVA